MRYLLAACIIALSGCFAPTQSNQRPAGEAAPIAATAVSGNMMSLLNAARASQGLGPVREDNRLSRSARGHAQSMVSNDFFAHQGLNGSRFTTRAQASGYGCALAENIAYGQRTRTRVVEVWMNSAGHRRNILDPRATEFGIGRGNNHWVLVMGRGC